MSFDIDNYARTAAPVRWDDLDLDSFARHPLSDALRCLRYMSDVETHTVCYLRDLLVTPSHADPEVTVFLTMWNMEEFWHGELLDAVLHRHGVPTGAEHTSALRKRLGWSDRLAPVRQSLLANLIIGKDFIATHMAWGAIKEWYAHSAYNRLIQSEKHPVLTEILRRIARQETRHVAFYNSQARHRLERSRKAQRIARFALNKAWGIVGSTVMPVPEVRHMLGYLYGGPGGLAEVRKVDAKIDSLPGQHGLRLVERQLTKYGIIAAA